jgi:hypothetical protein
MRRNRNFRGRGRRRVVQRPKTVEQRTGLRQAGIITNGNRRYPGPITIPLRQVIMIQVSNSSALASNASGVIAGVIPCDPTATLSAPFTAAAMFPQFADWNLVLGQVRCVQLDVTVTPAQANETKGDINASLAIAGNVQNTTTPSSYADVMNNSDSQIYPILLDDRGLGRYHAIRHGKELGYASSVSPVPTPSLYQGCPGGIGFYGSGFPVSTTIGALRITGTYQMRMWT